MHSFSPGTRRSLASPVLEGSLSADPDAIAITRQGGTGTDSRILTHPSDMPMRFESGTPNYPGIASLYAGIRFISSTGLETIGKKNRDLTRLFIRELKNKPGITIYNDAPDLPVVSFNIKGIDNHEAGYILARAYNVITRTGLHCAPLVHNVLTAEKAVSGQVSRGSPPVLMLQQQQPRSGRWQKVRILRSVQTKVCVDGSLMKEYLLDKPLTEDFLKFLEQFGTVRFLDQLEKTLLLL